MIVKKLTEYELIIMKFIWEKNSDTAKKEIIEVIKKEYGWKRNTVTITLKKLIKKNFLTKEIRNLHTYYKVIIKEDEYLNCKKEDSKVNTYNSNFISSISTMHKDENLSEEKLNSLEEWVKSWEEEK